VNALLADLARSLNPVLVADAIGMVPDPWQDDVLRSRHPRILLNCHRQSGKSTVSGILAVHTAIYEPGSLILLIAPALRQAIELFKKCLEVYRNLGRPVAAEAENQLSLVLTNGSRIICLPGKNDTTRGFSAVRLLIIDEASRVEDSLIGSLRPMLAVSGGRLIALSTPAGKRGWFYEAWSGTGTTWKKVEVTADKCPRITKAFLEEELLVLRQLMYEQEYFCRFVEQKDQVFGEAMLNQAFSRDVEALSL
jgi:hypothetical protein